MDFLLLVWQGSKITKKITEEEKTIFRKMHSIFSWVNIFSYNFLEWKAITASSIFYHILMMHKSWQKRNIKCTDDW